MKKDKNTCRLLVDHAVISLWNAMRDLSDHDINGDDEEVMTPADRKIWGLVNNSSGSPESFARSNRP